MTCAHLYSWFCAHLCCTFAPQKLQLHAVTLDWNKIWNLKRNQCKISIINLFERKEWKKNEFNIWNKVVEDPRKRISKFNDKSRWKYDVNALSTLAYARECYYTVLYCGWCNAEHCQCARSSLLFILHFFALLCCCRCWNSIHVLNAAKKKKEEKKKKKKTWKNAKLLFRALTVYHDVASCSPQCALSKCIQLWTHYPYD